MSRFTFRVAIAFLAFTVGVAATALWFFSSKPFPDSRKPFPDRTKVAVSNSASISQKVESQLKPVAGDRSEPLFAETINERAKEANLFPLKSKKLNRDDLEFQVWVGFGKKPLEGFVIKRVAAQWEGTFLESINLTTKPPYRKQLSPPKSGWEQFWSQLLDAGLLSLPDSSQLKDEVEVFDGTSYVVEVKKDGVYRTYAYMNPDYQKWAEAKQMLRIADILYTELGIAK